MLEILSGLIFYTEKYCREGERDLVNKMIPTVLDLPVIKKGGVKGFDKLFKH